MVQSSDNILEAPSKITYERRGFASKNDRSYHKNESASYVLPNDKSELDRLFVQHYMIFKFLNGHYLAPIEEDLKKGITVLDSGCGPGAWTTDMAKAYPNSIIHGIDISSVVPEHFKLRNTVYKSGNIAKNFPYEDNYFDYIHQRLLIAGLTRSDWIDALRNFYRTLKPGGYIELLETKNYDYENAQPLWKELSDTFYNMLYHRGMVPEIYSEIRRMVKEAGFVNVTVVYKDFSMNYEEEEGRKQWENMTGGFEGCALELIKYNDNWKDLSDFDKHMEKMRKEVLTTKTLHEYVIVYAQKPF